MKAKKKRNPLAVPAKSRKAGKIKSKSQKRLKNKERKIISEEIENT